jgi:hypothetical protein
MAEWRAHIHFALLDRRCGRTRTNVNLLRVSDHAAGLIVL